MRRTTLLTTVLLPSVLAGLALSCVVDDGSQTSFRSITGSTPCRSDDDCGKLAVCVPDESGAGYCKCPEGTTGADCEWSSAEVIPEFAEIGPVDPRKWHVDKATGRRFRHATSAEIARHGWKPGAFIVEAQPVFEAMRSTGESIEVLVPMTLDTARTVGFRWITAEEGPPMVELGEADGRAVMDGTRAVFHRYASEIFVEKGRVDLLGALATATAVEGDTQLLIEGHVEREGIDGTSIDRIEVLPLNNYWDLDAMPSGTGLEDMLLLQWSPAATALKELPQDMNLCPPPIVTEADFDPYTPLDDDAPEHHPCVEPGESPHPGNIHECDNGYDDDGDGSRDVDGAPLQPGDHVPDPMCQHSDQCEPGYEHEECLLFENDCDPGLMRPDHEHNTESGLSYGQFGDVVWCTVNESTWKIRMQQLNQKTLEALETPAYDNPEYNAWVGGQGRRSMVWRASKCWLRPTVDAAEACRDSWDCGPFDQDGEHPYPYHGDAKNAWSQHLLRGQADLHHAVHLPEPFNTIDYPLDMWFVIVHENDDVEHSEWGGTSKVQRRGAVINGGADAMYDPDVNKEGYHDKLGRRVAHELAHALGCEHCDAEDVPIWGDVCDENWENCVPGEKDIYGASLMITDDEDEMKDCADRPQSAGSALRFGPKCSTRIIDENLNDFNRRDPNLEPTFGKPIDEVPIPHWG